MKEVIVMLLLRTGCTGGKSAAAAAADATLNPERNACYDEADRVFDEVVDQCEEDGLEYEECEPLKQAEVQHREDMKACP